MKGWKSVLTVIGAILVVVLLRSCVATSYLIPSSGMENTLYQGERILVNKWSYGLRLPSLLAGGYCRWADRPVRKEDILVFNNPANLSERAIDRREVFIGRCIGTPGDTLLIDSVFCVSPSEKNAPDQKFLYAYPRGKEHQLDSLLTILSIAPGPLLGQDSAKNVRSFSRYEFYLLEQAFNGRCWIEPIDKACSAESLKPLIVPGKGRVLRVYPQHDPAAQHAGASRKEAGRNKERYVVRRRETHPPLLLYPRLLLGGGQQCHQPVRLAPVWLRAQGPRHRQGLRRLVL